MKPLNIVTCPRCLLKLESPVDPPYELPRQCPHCGGPNIGVGHTFDAACWDALQRMRSADSKGVHTIYDHVIYIGSTETGEQLMHLVKARREC